MAEVLQFAIRKSCGEGALMSRGAFSFGGTMELEEVQGSQTARGSEQLLYLMTEGWNLCGKYWVFFEQCRVRTVLENLEKSLNFKDEFPGPGKVR